MEAVAGVAEEFAAGEPEGAGEQFVLLRAEIGELDLAFAFQRVGGEGRVQQDVGEEIQPGLEVAGHHFGVHAEAVVAAARKTNREPETLSSEGDDVGCAAIIHAGVDG